MLKIRIETKNAAFEDCGEECARILKEVATKLEKGLIFSGEGVCHDINGNKVGTWKLTKR